MSLLKDTLAEGVFEMCMFVASLGSASDVLGKLGGAGLFSGTVPVVDVGGGGGAR